MPFLELASAIAPSERRLYALNEALDEFDHHDELRHDEEIKACADMILFQRLALSLAIDHSSEEIPLICTALDMVYRSSRPAIADSFNQVGMTVIPLIMQVIKRPPQPQQPSLPPQPEAEQRPKLHPQSEYVNDQQISAPHTQNYIENQSGWNDTSELGKPQYSFAMNPQLRNITQNELPTQQQQQQQQQQQLPQNEIQQRSFENDNQNQNYDQTQKNESPNNTSAYTVEDEIASQSTSPHMATSEQVSEHNADESHLQKKNPVSFIQQQEIQDKEDDIDRSKHDSSSEKQDDDQVDETNFEDDDGLIDVDLISQFNDFIEEDKRLTQNPGSDGQEQATPSISLQERHHLPSELKYSDNSIRSEGGSDLQEPQPHSELEVEWARPSEPDPVDDIQNVPTHIVTEPQQLNSGLNPNIISGMQPLPMDTLESAIGVQVHESAMNKMLSVLRHFSRVLNAMVPLAHYPGLIDAIIYQIQRCSIISDRYHEEERTKARIDAIAIMVNLACADKNKIILTENDAVMQVIVQLANNDVSVKVREHATIVLLNLSYAPENKIRIANYDHVLTTLSKLMTDESSYTRRYAAASLYTLASEPSNAEVISTHEGGIILEALRLLLLNDDSEEARISASEAFFIMARSHSNATLSAFAKHYRLLDSIAQSVISDYNADVRAFSARALEWLAADIHHPMPYHQNLLSALVKASRWTKTSSIAEAMKNQASLEHNRQVMGAHPGLLEELANLSMLDKPADFQTKSYAIAAIERLSTEPMNMSIMAKNSLIMTALTRANFSSPYEDQNANTDGISSNSYLLKTALKNLADYI